MRDALYTNNCFSGPDINPNCFNNSNFPYSSNFTNDINYVIGNAMLPSSSSVPANLQLCGCYMRDIAKNTSQLTHLSNLSSSSSVGNTAYSSTATVDLDPNLGIIGNVKLSDITKTPDDLNNLIRPRKLRLDKTLSKYKLHKSLPVSPVTEERQFSDYVEQKQPEPSNRKSFSYFIDFKESTEDGFKQICNDIEKFSKDFNKTYEQLEKHFDTQIDKSEKNCSYLEVPKVKHSSEEEEGNFSSDSLEEYSFLSACNKKVRSSVPPRRCMSNNEIYKHDNYQEDYFECEIPKSESFYLNQNIRSSQDSILSDENILEDNLRKSNCNSMESILSNDSDCKSAPLEALFSSQKTPQRSPKHSSSCHDNFFTCPPSFSKAYELNPCQDHRNFELSPVHRAPKILKTTQTQTDFATPEELVLKKTKASEEFQRKLLKFEESIAQTELRRELKRNIAFFIDTGKRTKQKTTSDRVGQENLPLQNSNKQLHIKTKGDTGKKQATHTDTNVKMYIPTLETKTSNIKVNIVIF
ncbi:hypothetical protein HHI36_022460 [Cryptolaemus montrouzieri]|uniref:Uncharacterized protein n=1 Tax=Cryptolaemus montrouzieri TaxID=559131 RepID=A0ABD2N0Q6_9CUCU